MRFYFFLFFLTLMFNLSSQDYFNIIIPFDNGNPNAVDVNPYENSFLIPVIYPGEVSTIIKINEDGNNIDYFDFNYFDFSRHSLNIINGYLYAYAKDRTQVSDLRVMKLSPDLNMEFVATLSTPEDYTFPTYSIAIQNYLYTSSFIDYEMGAHREINIKKIDTLGQEVWSKNLNENIELSYPWELLKAHDNNLLSSSGVHYYTHNGRYSQLTKLDTAGNIIWNTEGTERFDNGAVPAWVAQLSDSSIVQSYEINKGDDINFLLEGWDERPTRLKWFNRDGEPQQEKLLRFPQKHEMHLSQIEAGKGDYFFAYGEYQLDDIDEYFGLLIKFDNQGDTIWHKLYRHPEYAHEDEFNLINDIIELDNGDIVMMGQLYRIGEESEIWLLKVNEHGCFGTPECDDLLPVDVDTIPQENEKEMLKVFPNPTSETLTIQAKGGISIKGCTLLNIVGVEVMEYPADSTEVVLEVEDLASGVYVLLVQLDNGEVVTEKVVVE